MLDYNQASGLRMVGRVRACAVWWRIRGPVTLDCGWMGEREHGEVSE